MQRISLILACLACLIHGRRVPSFKVKSQNRLLVNRLLSVLTPSSAFHPAAPAAHSGMVKPTRAAMTSDLHPAVLDRMTGVEGKAQVVMSDAPMPTDQEVELPKAEPEVSSGEVPSSTEAHINAFDSNPTLAGDSEPDTFRRIAYRRRTARDYDETKDVPDDVMADILATSQRAPTGYNMQPYKIIVVSDQKKREELSKAFVGDGNIRRVKKAPVTVIFLADLEPARLIPRIVELSQKQGLPNNFLMSLAVNVAALTVPGRFGPPTPLNLATSAVSPFAALPVFNDVEAWAFKNTMLVASQMMLAAASHGVSSSPMEGFDTRRIFQTLKVPFTDWPRYAIPLAISMGYDADGEIDTPSLRLPPEEVYFKDDFSTTYEGITSM